jgi:hypothetical protein
MPGRDLRFSAVTSLSLGEVASSGADRQRHGPARQDGVPICHARGKYMARSRFYF